jgi:hypothetical protein
LELVFENGQRMAFVDGRRFAKVKLADDPLLLVRACVWVSVGVGELVFQSRQCVAFVVGGPLQK